MAPQPVRSRQPPTWSARGKGDTHYVHVLNYVSDCLKLKGLVRSFTGTVMGNGATVKCERKGEELVITIPPEVRDPYDTVVRLNPA